MTPWPWQFECKPQGCPVFWQ